MEVEDKDHESDKEQKNNVDREFDIISSILLKPLFEKFEEIPEGPELPPWTKWSDDLVNEENWDSNTIEGVINRETEDDIK